MPRKKGYRHIDETRAKIQASQIINRLSKCVKGEIELSAVQVNAAKILLNKVLPDLSSVDINAIVDQRTTVVSSDPLTSEEWADQYTQDGQRPN